MIKDNFRTVAQAIVAKQKGVLAADESNPTIKKRFDTIKVESTEENRRRYREILFTTEGMLFEGMLLKPNMVIAGQKCAHQESVSRVAEATIRCLARYVPAAVPGIVFLSGGQSAADATDHLNAINMLGPHPWQISFSYGRALQAPVLSAWKGREGNLATAQKTFLKRCMLNGLARDGKYAREMETAE